MTTGDTNIRVNDEPVTLNFSTSNWNVAQTITVSADEDGDDIAGTRNIGNSAAGAEFTGVEVDVTATERDNDRRGFVVSHSGPVHMNEGADHTYTIKLGTQPTVDVTVAISVGDGSDTDITVAPASLTFNSTNYGTAQTVTISAAQDDTDYADDLGIITHRITTDDAIYTEQYISSIAVTAKDNDAALMLRNDADDADITTIEVPEKGTAAYKVKLTNQPTGDVTVTIAEATSTSDDSNITVSSPSGKTLTFTTSNWDTPQTVTLSAANDSDTGNEVNGTRQIKHTAAGGGFDSAPVQTLTAIESDTAAKVILWDSQNDNDISNISVSESDLQSTYNAPYRVKLGAQPAADVTVAIAKAAGGDPDITVTTPSNPKTLTFTTGNWNEPQQVILTAAEDSDDLLNGTATITHTASNGGYNGVSASLTATEKDNTGQIKLTDAGGNSLSSPIYVP